MPGHLVRDLHRRRNVRGLIDLLASSRARTVALAAAALGSLGSPEAVGPLIELTRHPRQRVRVAAVRALGGIPSEASVPVLTEALFAGDDQNLLVAGEAARSLGQLRDAGVAVPAEVAQELIRRLGERRHHRLRRPPEVSYLGSLRDPAAIEPLLSHMEALVREYPDKRDLWGHLHDLLRALAEIGDPRVCDAVAKLQDQVPEDFQREADATLIKLGDNRGLEHLMTQIRDGSPHSWAYGRTLADLAAPWTAPALTELMAMDDVALRVYAAAALERLGHPRAGSVLREFLGHPDRRRRHEPGVALLGLAVTAQRALRDPLQIPLEDRLKRTNSNGE